MDADFLFRAIQALNVCYVDKLFGHFLLIPGTKTLADIQSDTAGARFLRLKRKYLGTLPFSVRLRYLFRHMLSRL